MLFESLNIVGFHNEFQEAFLNDLDQTKHEQLFFICQWSIENWTTCVNMEFRYDIMGIRLDKVKKVGYGFCVITKTSLLMIKIRS